MNKKNRVIALFLTVVVFFTFIFSVSFIIHESDHECIGENCQVCVLILSVNESVKNISCCVFACVAVLVLMFYNYRNILNFINTFLQNTPVVLRVKLLN